MTIDFRSGVSILKLVIYTPYLFASLYVCTKMGFMKGSGWIYLSIFCVFRIVGASAELASISSSSTTPYTVAAICSAVGLTPLLLASLGLLSRVYYSLLNSPWKGMLFSMTILRLPMLVTTVAGILCIVGATSAQHIQDFTSETTVHIGVILYVVSYIILLVLTFAAFAIYLKKRTGEKALLIALGLALPFLLTRLLYSLIACFAHNASSFNLVTGSVAINLVMAVLEEIVIVAIYTITGIKLEVVPKEQQQQSAAKRMTYRARRGDFGTGKLGSLGLAMAGVNELANIGNDRVVPEGEKETGFPGPARGDAARPSRGRGRTVGAGMC